MRRPEERGFQSGVKCVGDRGLGHGLSVGGQGPAFCCPGGGVMEN